MQLAAQTQPLSLPEIRHTLMGAYSRLPAGNSILSKWYHDAAIGKKPARAFLGTHYPDLKLYLSISREIYSHCEMLARAATLKLPEKYIDNTIDKLVTQAFQRPFTNPPLVPKDRLLLALGTYLQHQKAVTDEQYPWLMESIEPALQALQLFLGKPVHPRELAYIGAVAALRPISIPSAEKKMVVRSSPAVRSRLIASKPIIEEFRRLFVVDWSNKPSNQLNDLPVLDLKEYYRRKIARCVVPVEGQATRGGMPVLLNQYKVFQEVPAILEALKVHNPPILTRQQFHYFAQIVFDSESAAVTRNSNLFLDGLVLKGNTIRPTPTTFTRKIVEALKLSLPEALASFGVTDRPAESGAGKKARLRKIAARPQQILKPQPTA